MSPQLPHNGSAHLQQHLKLSEEAAEWFLRMLSPEADPEELHGNPITRNAAFRAWYSRSPQHVWAFLDMCELDYMMPQLFTQHRTDFNAMLAMREPAVIPLDAPR